VNFSWFITESPTMSTIEQTMKSRISRANLDTTKYYIKIYKLGGATVEEEVGRFLKSYTMGSGDGMTLHWEFELNGKIRRIDDEMWGSVSGAELVGFRPM
jgi:hypothetical protein